MKILFKDIISNQGQIKYSIDNGITWTTCDIEEVRDGITIPNNTPLENIKAKAVISDMSNIKDVSNLSGSLGIAETPIILVDISGAEYVPLKPLETVSEDDDNYGTYQYYEPSDGNYFSEGDSGVQEINNNYYYVDSSSGSNYTRGHYNQGDIDDGSYIVDTFSRIFIFDEYLEEAQRLNGDSAHNWSNMWNCNPDNLIDRQYQNTRKGYNLAFRRIDTDDLYAYIDASEALSDYEIVLTYVTKQGPVDVVYSLGTANKLIQTSINEFAAE